MIDSKRFPVTVTMRLIEFGLLHSWFTAGQRLWRVLDRSGVRLRRVAGVVRRVLHSDERGLIHRGGPTRVAAIEVALYLPKALPNLQAFCNVF